MPTIPGYNPPDFTAPHLVNAPVVSVEVVPADGVVPRNFHGTSNHPEYVHLGDGHWVLAPESRMDAVMVLDGISIDVVEARRVRKGDQVVVGRTEPIDADLGADIGAGQAILTITANGG